jgi:hypothetical protein
MGLFGVNDLDQSLWPIRALLADPPGLAGSGRRGKVFHAAIEQFEQLLRASHSIGPASSPILVFYALAQAGRAILAAHGVRDSWDTTGHGLSVVTRQSVGQTTISPSGDGLFQAVAAATGSAALTSEVSLSEAWGASPRFIRAPGLGDEAPPLFLLSDRASSSPTVRSEHGGPIRFDEFWDRKSEYPGAAAATFDPVPTSIPNQHVFQLVSFPDDDSRQAFEDALVGFAGERYLRIPLGEARDQPSGLMTWWMTLLALSSLARYEPAGWTAALTPRSRLAVPIEATLNKVILRMPRMVLDAMEEGETGGSEG